MQSIHSLYWLHIPAKLFYICIVKHMHVHELMRKFCIASSLEVSQKCISFIILQKCCHYSHRRHAWRKIIVHSVQHADVIAALSESIKVKGEHLQAFWSEKTSLAGDIPSYHHPHKEDDGEVWKTGFCSFHFEETIKESFGGIGFVGMFSMMGGTKKGREI